MLLPCLLRFGPVRPRHSNEVIEAKAFEAVKTVVAVNFCGGVVVIAVIAVVAIVIAVIAVIAVDCG